MRPFAAAFAFLPLAGSCLPALALPIASAPPSLSARIVPVDSPLYRRHLRHGGPLASPGPQTDAGRGGTIPYYGTGPDPRPNGGFSVNNRGNGNYTMGTDGGFGGYPPGSDGAKELRVNQERKCEVYPESC